MCDTADTLKPNNQYKTLIISYLDHSFIHLFILSLFIYLNIYLFNSRHFKYIYISGYNCVEHKT